MTTGFDPEFHYYHPGLFLLLDIFKQLCHDPACEAIDFGFGEADYKRMFSSEIWRESEFYLFARTVKGYQLKLLKTFLEVNRLIAEKILKKLKLFNVLKKVWRQRLSSATKQD